MRRISLFTLVVFLPLISAAWLAWGRHRLVLRQKQALQILDRAIKKGRVLPTGRIVNDFGHARAVVHFERVAESELLSFDGKERLVQIQKNGFNYAEGSLDLLYLHDFSDGIKIAIQQPPIGTVIDSVVFAGNGVDISLHGDLLVNGTRITVPANVPEVYHLSWFPGSPPASPPLETMIEKRQRP